MGRASIPISYNSASSPCSAAHAAPENIAPICRAALDPDANDSYFAAMTYPQGLPLSMPVRRHS